MGKIKTHEESCREFTSGFRGYKNRVTSKLTDINWEKLYTGIKK